MDFRVRLNVMAEGAHPGSAELHSAPKFRKDAHIKSAIPKKKPFLQAAAGYQPSLKVAPGAFGACNGSQYTIPPPELHPKTDNPRNTFLFVLWAL